ENVADTLAEMASTIKTSIGELNAIGDLPETKPIALRPKESTPGFPEILSDEDILSSKDLSAIEKPADEIKLEGVPDFTSCPSTNTYHAFTKAFDEIVEASKLADQGQILKLQ